MAPSMSSRDARVLLVACGAISHEIVALLKRHGWSHLAVQCLPADLHNRPEKIPEAVRAKVRAARGRFEHVFVAYADCGTGGLLDEVCEEEGVERIPGAHCYEFFAGAEAFAALCEEEVGTLYLTDFLARHFERLMIHGLGIDRHPELESMYFGNYRRVVYLSQVEDAELLRMARAAADRLGLEFEHRHTGYGELEPVLVEFEAHARAGRG